MTVPAAVLWDMDGTLVDTEPYWLEAEFELAVTYGGAWSREHGLQLVGSDLLRAAAYVLEHMFSDPGSPGASLAPERIVELLLDAVVTRVERQVPWRPGAVELLVALREAGVPCALVTMSYQRFVAPIVDVLAPGAFTTVVTGDMVTNGKPHPEPYLAAAAALGVAPADCVAIEDSNTGAASAAAAGCIVLCVPNHVAIDTGERRVFRDTLVGLTPADLGALQG